MARRILAIILGVVAGIIIVFIGDATVHSINPPPLGLEYMDKNVMNDYIAKIPTYVMVIMVIFWLLSSFVAGLVAALVKRSEWKKVALITGSILLATALLNLALVSHPIWMWIVALAGYIPAAMLGGYLVRPKTLTTAL